MKHALLFATFAWIVADCERLPAGSIADIFAAAFLSAGDSARGLEVEVGLMRE